jgi:hypothetical protein
MILVVMRLPENLDTGVLHEEMETSTTESSCSF